MEVILFLAGIAAGLVLALLGLVAVALTASAAILNATSEARLDATPPIPDSIRKTRPENGTSGTWGDAAQLLEHAGMSVEATSAPEAPAPPPTPQPSKSDAPGAILARTRCAICGKIANLFAKTTG